MKVPVRSELFPRNRAVEITTGSGAVREVIPGSVRQRTNLRIPHPWFTNWRLENAADHNAVGRYVIVVPFAMLSTFDNSSRGRRPWTECGNDRLASDGLDVEGN